MRALSGAHRNHSAPASGTSSHSVEKRDGTASPGRCIVQI